MRWDALVMVAVFGAGCGGRPVVRRQAPASQSHRRLILERAAQLPWTDEGRCVVEHASAEWRTVVERCHPALDWSRLQVRDMDHRCAVANADAASVQAMVGVCLLVQPELVIGAIVIIGVVVVAAAIAAELNKPPRDRCEEIAATCRETCSETDLPTKNGDGFAFWRCVNACLERNGCAPGMY